MNHRDKETLKRFFAIL